MWNHIGDIPNTLDEHITNLEDQFFDLFPECEDKNKALGLFNEIVQYLIVRTDNVMSGREYEDGKLK
jgi:hypothetical protein